MQHHEVSPFYVHSLIVQTFFWPCFMLLCKAPFREMLNVSLIVVSSFHWHQRSLKACVSLWMGPKFLFLSVFYLLFSPPSLSPLGGLRARLHSSSSVPNFLKFQFLAPVQENDSPEPKIRYTHTFTPNNHALSSVSSIVIICVPRFIDHLNSFYISLLEIWIYTVYNIWLCGLLLTKCLLGNVI